MLNKLMELLRRAPPPTNATVGAPFARREIAVVALLIEAAQIDRASSTEELAAVERIVRERLARRRSRRTTDRGGAQPARRVARGLGIRGGRA